MRLRLLLGILILSGIIFVLQDIALAEFLYWRWWWFDILMHFLGGVLVGALALFVSDLFKTPFTLTFVIFLVGIGVGWEVFERMFGLYNAIGYWEDTILDLIMDTIGALIVYAGVKLWK